jgi:hypothetical protein
MNIFTTLFAGVSNKLAHFKTAGWVLVDVIGDTYQF